MNPYFRHLTFTCLALAAQANATISGGDIIGVDFGSTTNNDNYNQYAFNAGSISLSNTSGSALSGVSFEATGLAVNGSNREIGNSGLTTGNDVWGDYAYSNVANQSVTLTFTGLDDALSYVFFGGQDRDTGAENFDATYSLSTGTTTESSSFISDATIDQGYGTISEITPTGGVITITITPIDDNDGNEWVGIAVAELRAEGETIAPPETADIDVGTVIGVDFSSSSDATTHWNTLTSVNADISAGSLTDTNGSKLNYISLNTSGAAGEGNPTASSPTYTSIPATAQTDWWYESGASSELTFEFNGLDDGLIYELVIGAYRPSASGDQIENGNTGWNVNGSSLETDLLDAADSYVTFSNLSSVNGVLTIQSESINSNDVSVVSALQLTATGGTPVGPPPPLGPPALQAGVALNFDPQYATGSAALYDLDGSTLGGTWTTSLSGDSQFEETSRGYAYVFDSENAEGDSIELTLDEALEFESSEIAIHLQMLATNASASGDNEATLIGYDGDNEIFRVKYTSHTDSSQNNISLTTALGEESVGATPLKGLSPPTLPSGLQDFYLTLYDGQVSINGSSLLTQSGQVMNAATSLSRLRWEITGTNTAEQGLWLDDLIIWDTPPSSPRAPTERPNVIFILMDDMGYSDVSAYGAQDVDTPNIDALAHGGLQFTHFHSGANICSPARASFLTGAYPQRAGLPYGINENRESHWFMGLSPNEITLAEQFRKQSYKTLMIGKWHLGTEEIFSYYNQGFDTYYGAPSNLGHNKEFLDERDFIFSVSNDAQEARLTSLYTQRAREYIRTHRDRPFFFFYSHQYPHTPYTEGNAFDGATGNGTRADVLREVDWSIGQIVTELEANGILENTILVFTADNGATGNQYCLPFRGTKFVTYEGGHRVPFIFYWKDQIQTPRYEDTPTVSMDLFPTLSEIIGEPLPSDRIYDGVSLVPLFTDQTISRAIDEPFYYYNGENLQAVRKGHLKLHVPRDSNERPFWDQQAASSIYRLYDLSPDSGAANSLVGNEAVDESNAVITFTELSDVALDNAYREDIEELLTLAEEIRPVLGDYMLRGSEQRETGSLFPEVPIVQNLTDWNSLLTTEEQGRGHTLFGQDSITLGQSYTAASSVAGGWQYLESSEALGGNEVVLTAGQTVDSQANSGYIGAGTAAVLGGADTGSYVIDSTNTANNAVAGTDFLITTDADDARDFVILRYTISAGDIAMGHVLASISGSFRDLVGGTSDNSVSAQVFHNTTSLFTATGASGQLTQADGAFALNDVAVSAGDTLSFVVGSQGDSTGDEVALRASLSFSASDQPVWDLGLAAQTTANTSNGIVTLDFYGTPGLAYSIEKTTDLTDSSSWEEVENIPVLPTSPYQLHLEMDPYSDKAFWRVNWQE
ncbi:sulfatase-like hydrolase/transferase [Rubritalea sp.]|uniref:sulfatase-like hydrolase/transferase n=1 Tax=Rubritalea sp. TaxID=2109375 RepID=UPI003EFA4BAD